MASPPGWEFSELSPDHDDLGAPSLTQGRHDGVIVA